MNKSGITIKALASLVFALSLYSAAQAQARVFVSGLGSDSNPCSRTSPCRTFQHGHDVVAAGGEVIALDSAGYGGVSITKSVRTNGIRLTAGGNLHVENCVVTGFGSGGGISVPSGAGASARLFVKDTICRG